MRATAIDLFAGAGGLSLGLAEAGFEVVLAVDSWQLAVDTYSKNLGESAVHGDLDEMDASDILRLAGLNVGEVDLLAGGPPCQGFSVQRIGRDHDQRNRLVLDYADLIAAVQPRMFLMENVLGLLGKRGQQVSSEFVRRLREAGYEIAVARVNAVDYGVPQNRRRVLFIGTRADETPFVLGDPRPSDPVTVWEAIGDLPRPAPPGSRIASDPMHVESRLSETNRERLALIPPGGGFEDLPRELRVDCHRAGADAIGHRGVYGRLHPDRPAGTITARFDSFTRGRFGHPYAHRNLTMREGARLQTFPDWFQFLGNREEIAAQIGNAVPPRLANAVGRQMIGHLALLGGLESRVS